MDRFLYQDISTCIHNHEYHNKFSAVMKEYKDTIALVCRFDMGDNFFNNYDLPISTIESKNIGYMGESDPYIVEPVEISILKKNNYEDLRDGFISDYAGGNLQYVCINFRECLGPESIYDLYMYMIHNLNNYEVVRLPDNYMYTYEKEGWLKEVVDSSA